MPPKDIKKKKISLERPKPSKEVWEQDKKAVVQRQSPG